MEVPWKGCCARRHIISRGVNQKVEGFPPVWWWCPLEITLVNYFTCISHRIHGAAITWIPSIYPLYVSIYTSTMDPSWVFFLFWNISNLLIFRAIWWFQSNLQPECCPRINPGQWLISAGWWDLPCKFGARGCPFWQLSSTRMYPYQWKLNAVWWVHHPNYLIATS